MSALEWFVSGLACVWVAVFVIDLIVNQLELRKLRTRLEILELQQKLLYRHD